MGQFTLHYNLKWTISQSVGPMTQEKRNGSYLVQMDQNGNSTADHCFTVRKINYVITFVSKNGFYVVWISLLSPSTKHYQLTNISYIFVSVVISILLIAHCGQEYICTVNIFVRLLMNRMCHLLANAYISECVNTSTSVDTQRENG